MKSGFYSQVFTISLTIFAMLFGSGNLMFPPTLGIEMGQHTWLGFLGFCLSGVVLPMVGILAIVMFDGNYEKFFGRLRAPLGDIFIFLCMFIIGPAVILPRIVMLPYEMLKSFLPLFITPLIFVLFFLGLVFIATYRADRLLNIVGKFLSPLKVITLLVIVAAGLFSGSEPAPVEGTSWELFGKAFTHGFLTLDLIGALFFGAIVVHLLTKSASSEDRISMSDAVKVTAIASVFAGLLMGGVYLGMTLLGAYHGQGLEGLKEGAVFREIVFRVLGDFGAAFVGASVFLACFTTCVSLTAVVAEYIQIKSHNRFSYIRSVFAVLFLTALIAQSGLDNILTISWPYIVAFYPLIIVITLCNLAYKMFDFKPITGPVLLTALIIVAYKLVSTFGQII